MDLAAARVCRPGGYGRADRRPGEHLRASQERRTGRLPLLRGPTTLNPAAYPPQDLEAIRTIVTAELNELVSELAWEGGPRIQRVDELFVLLLGENHRSFSPNPDRAKGQLGILRDRFALTEDQIDTVDEERVVTNFRVIVEQVLALQASWFKDRPVSVRRWVERGLKGGDPRRRC